MQHRKLESAAEYPAALDELFARAQRTIRIFDRRLGADYNSPERFDLLRNFLLADRSNRIYVVLHDSGGLAASHPRLLLLLKQFSHGISVNETQTQMKGIYDPFTVIDESHYLHRFHYEHPRSLLGWNDAPGARQLLQRFATIWEASFPAVSAATLGL